MLKEIANFLEKANFFSLKTDC
ncbi:unknown protein [Waddlia chondrophila 2032/99]|uniref:Uncharacterized protein n=1 Tax=Waddlia chondrophila 2032/99 TaxID=765953 RepID=F8LCN7_9BACT|nr:unknown protein [Waddlia chondrophila 2032/99]